jgi:pSer/pThr/pTyr-binding forkhead associated (FHA) protein/tetratricopeptide (TPR) repeat protein
MAEDIRSRRRRRSPPGGRREAGDERTTDEQLPAAQENPEQDTLDSGPIHQELARRGLGSEDRLESLAEPEADLSDPDADALVFDGPAAGDAGATFVGELPAAEPAADKTAILSLSDVAPPDQVPVLTIETADGQSDVEIMTDRFVIGRSPECDVVLPDQLVSRQHAVIENRGGDWYIVDQQSGNGTFLNDKRISEEPLYDGDEVHIGDARIIFTAPGGSGGQIPHAPNMNATMMLPAVEGTNVTGLSISPAKRKKKKLLLVMGVVVVLIGVMGIAKKLTTPLEPTPEQIAAQEAAEEAAALEEARQQAFAEFEKVKELLKENRWSEALPLIRAAAQVLPEDRSVQEYRQTIERESEAERVIAAARTQLTDRNFEAAIASLAAITHESVFDQEIRSLKTQAEAGMRESRLEAAALAMRDKRYQEAIDAADEVLRSSPGEPSAQDLKRRAEEALRRQQSTPPPCTGPGCGKKPPPPPPPPPKSKYLLAGQSLDLYQANKVDEALAQTSGSGVSQDGVKTLREFQQISKSGLSMANNVGQAEQAIKLLTKALALDKMLGGGKGEVTNKLKGTLSKVHFLRGVDAQTSNNFPLAYQSFTQALQYKPDLKTAEERIKKLELEAKKLFETAYVIKSTAPEKALSNCQTVTKMVHKSNPYYGKCKKMVQQLQGGGEDAAEEF